MYTIVTAAAAVGRNKTAILRRSKPERFQLLRMRTASGRSTPPNRDRIISIAERIHAGQKMPPQLDQLPLLTRVED